MGAHSAPVLETERLLLRGFERADFPAYKAMMEQPGVLAFLGGIFEGHENLWRRTLAGVGQWSVNGFGSWMVFRKEDGLLIGTVGLFDAQRELESGFDEEPEMGWIFGSEVHGQGFASEACLAVLDWADTHLARPIWAIIDPANAASFKLAAKLGFERIGVKPYRDEEIVLLKRGSRGA